MSRWVDEQVAPDLDALTAEMRTRYWHHVAQVAWPSKRAMQLHLTMSILPGAALYGALRERGLPAGEAVDAVAALIARRSASRRARLERLTRHRLVRTAFLPLAQLVTRVFFPSPGWETHWRERSGTAVAFDMSRCYFLDTFTALGMPELTRAFCAGDDVMYADLCPQLRWLRTGTLATGAPVCDFRFERAERPVPLGRLGRRAPRA